MASSDDNNGFLTVCVLRTLRRITSLLTSFHLKRTRCATIRKLMTKVDSAAASLCHQRDRSLGATQAQAATNWFKQACLGSARLRPRSGRTKKKENKMVTVNTSLAILNFISSLQSLIIYEKCRKIMFLSACYRKHVGRVKNLTTFCVCNDNFYSETKFPQQVANFFSTAKGFPQVNCCLSLSIGNTWGPHR